MASQPQPGPSTQGTAARAPPLVSVEGPAYRYRATLQKCVALIDWWLERGEGDEIRVAGYTERNRAARLFTSGSITLVHADGTLETADHKILLTRGPLNKSQMQLNGFPDEVSKYFQLGFPVQWKKYANSNMKQMNENTESSLKSTEFYIRKFLGGSYINSDFMEVDSKSSKGPTGKTDGPSSQGLSDLSSGSPRIQESSRSSGDYDNSVSKITPSEGLCNGRMGMPDESCGGHVPEGCGNTDEFPVRRLSSLANGTPRNQEPSGNSDDNRNSVINATASEGLCYGNMGMPDESCEDPRPGETCSGQTSQAAKPRDLEKLAKGLNPEFGLVQCSKDSTARTLRSGKVCGMSNGASFNKGRSKRKTVQQETSNLKVIPTEETTPPSDPTCHKNGGSAAQITGADKLQSKDLGHKGRGRPRKRARTSKTRRRTWRRAAEVEKDIEKSEDMDVDEGRGGDS